MFESWIKQANGNEPLYPLALGVPYSQLKTLFRYINEAFGLRCLPDMMEANIYPNAKEITESMAAFHVARHRVQMFDLGDPGVTVVAVADGATPRTAAMFAYRTAWQCISIDPNLSDQPWDAIVKRVTVIRKKVEDCQSRHFSKLVLAAVHSHAPLEVAAEKFTADERLIIAIPCCFEQRLDREPDLTYVDYSIWSPKNIVKVWVEGAKEA